MWSLSVRVPVGMYRSAALWASEAMGHLNIFEGLKHWDMNTSHNCCCSRQWEVIAFIRSKLLKYRNTRKKVDMLQRREKEVSTMKSGTDVEEIKKIRNSFRTLNLQIKENARPTMMKARSGVFLQRSIKHAQLLRFWLISCEKLL